MDLGFAHNQRRDPANDIIVSSAGQQKQPRLFTGMDYFFNQSPYQPAYR